MPVQDETQFILDLIKDAWPDGEFPDTVHRIHRDDALVLETNRRGLKAEAWPGVNVISAARVEQSLGVRGTEYDHDAETVVSCRAVGMHETQRGQVTDIDQWRTFTNHIREAILSDRSYPEIAVEGPAAITYQDLRIENWNDLSHEYRDEYRTEWDVRLTGIEQLPEL